MNAKSPTQYPRGYVLGPCQKTCVVNRASKNVADSDAIRKPTKFITSIVTLGEALVIAAAEGRCPVKRNPL